MKAPSSIERLEEAVSIARQELESGVASQGIGSLNKYESLLDEARQPARDAQGAESESSHVMDFDFEGHMRRAASAAEEPALGTDGSADSMQCFNSPDSSSGEGGYRGGTGAVASPGFFSGEPPLTVATITHETRPNLAENTCRGLDQRSREQESSRSR